MRDKVQSKVGKAFNKKLADAVHQFTCSKPIYSGEYDFETQTYPLIRVDKYEGRGVLFGSYSKDMVKPADYQAEDARAIVLQNEVTTVPQIEDEWETPRGVFKVVNIGADPADVTWIVQLRKVTG
ncbi:hypothetical protein EC844_12537 [Acinetobacter calcoaceticus]|uniref:Glutamate 5-kinase n=1 Tax=Acinetobacter calcoaceticus TaxID=471 RepID=A0A4R1XGP7_ACICA|nr:hypothetical protein EC844_12537 [Acinetobacter calcoaceticus]